MLFESTLAEGRETPLVDALISWGANLDFQVDGKGDTPLIGAASLGAEEVGIRLVEAGAQVDIRGAFGETALHWAALLGAERLTARLIEAGSDVNLPDRNWRSTPVGWARKGLSDAPAGNRGKQKEVIARLAAAGAHADQ
jgi:ankyrin repeat protein